MVRLKTLILATAFLVSSFWLRPLSAHADNMLSVSLSPTSVSIQPGQTFTINLYGDTGTDPVQAIWINIFFDSSHLEYKGFTRGANSFSDCGTSQFISDDEVTGECWNADDSTSPAGKYFIGTLSFIGSSVSQTTLYSDTSSSYIDSGDYAHDSTRVDVPVKISAPVSPPPSSGGTTNPPASSPVAGTSSKPSTSNQNSAAQTQPENKVPTANILKQVETKNAGNKTYSTTADKANKNLLLVGLITVALLLGLGFWKRKIILNFLRF